MIMEKVFGGAETKLEKANKRRMGKVSFRIRMMEKYIRKIA
jgi:hypothetical protein